MVRIISNRSGLFVVASDMAYSPYDEQTALMKKDSCLVTTKGFRVFAIRGLKRMNRSLPRKVLG